MRPPEARQAVLQAITAETRPSRSSRAASSTCGLQRGRDQPDRASRRSTSSTSRPIERARHLHARPVRRDRRRARPTGTRRFSLNIPPLNFNFSDKRVRQAMYYAIDRRAINDAALRRQEQDPVEPAGLQGDYDGPERVRVRSGEGQGSCWPKRGRGHGAICPRRSASTTRPTSRTAARSRRSSSSSSRTVGLQGRAQRARHRHLQRRSSPTNAQRATVRTCASAPAAARASARRGRRSTSSAGRRSRRLRAPTAATTTATCANCSSDARTQVDPADAGRHLRADRQDPQRRRAAAVPLAAGRRPRRQQARQGVEVAGVRALRHHRRRQTWSVTSVAPTISGPLNRRARLAATPPRRLRGTRWAPISFAAS